MSGPGSCERLLNIGLAVARISRGQMAAIKLVLHGAPAYRRYVLVPRQDASQCVSA